MTNQLCFHIGFHKTGSTWLQNELFLKSEYFNLINDFVRPWNDPIVSYLVRTPISEFDQNYFTDTVKRKFTENRVNIISAERLSGHPISGGFDSADIAKKIKLSFPDAKIILVKRNISSFKHSTYKQVIMEGYPGSTHDFFEFNHWKIPGPSNAYFKQSFIQDIHIELFGSKNVLELSFEEFTVDKRAFIKSISNFCKIKIDYDFNKKIINKTRSNRRMRALRSLNKFRRTEYNPYPILNISSKLIYLLSIIISVLFSNKNFK